jgi:hypothetical protein
MPEESTLVTSTYMFVLIGIGTIPLPALTDSVLDLTPVEYALASGDTGGAAKVPASQ